MATCEGTGQPAVTPWGTCGAFCPTCGREFGAQGRKAQARLNARSSAGNIYTAIPTHRVSA